LRRSLTRVRRVKTDDFSFIFLYGNLSKTGKVIKVKIYYPGL
jgi:hypothetical protein